MNDERGSTLPLIIFYGAFALILALVAADATSLYLEHKRLFTLADGASLVGAEAFLLDDVKVTPEGPRVTLKSSDVRAAVAQYLGGQPTDLDAVTLVRAASDDGRSATVTLSSIWHPPVITAFVPAGVRVEVTSVSRTVFD